MIHDDDKASMEVVSEAYKRGLKTLDEALDLAYLCGEIRGKTEAIGEMKDAFRIAPKQLDSTDR